MSRKPRKPKRTEGSRTHVFQCQDRTCTLVITEHADRVDFDMTMDKYGWSRDEDYQQFLRWMEPLADRYKDDPRLIVFPHPLTGQVAVIGGDANQGSRSWQPPQERPRAGSRGSGRGPSPGTALRRAADRTADPEESRTGERGSQRGDRGGPDRIREGWGHVHACGRFQDGQAARRLPG